jgi:hypothetical protein
LIPNISEYNTLRFKLKESHSIDIPYRAGSVELDAYIAGIDEAKDYFRENIKM